MTEPPKLPSDDKARESSEGTKTYQLVADTVGLVPSLRFKDNLWQGIIVGGLVLLCTPIGYFLWGGFGALGGALVGLTVGGLGTGTLLMIQGWKRSLRK